jgi:hypothetical protein
MLARVARSKSGVIRELEDSRARSAAEAKDRGKDEWCEIGPPEVGDVLLELRDLWIQNRGGAVDHPAARLTAHTVPGTSLTARAGRMNRSWVP